MINKTQSMFLVIFIAISLLFIAEIYEPAFKVWGVAFEKVMTKASTNTTEETNADQNYYRKKYSRVSSTEQYTTQNNHKVIDTDIGEILEYIFWLTYKNRLIQKISYIDIFISKNSYFTDTCWSRCKWPTKCKECNKCKMCLYCYSCTFPSNQCEHCNVCKTGTKFCLNCCGFKLY